MSQSRRLEVSIDDQILRVIDGDLCIREFNISTAAKGMGFVENSNRTPTGNFRVIEKIGDGEMPGTIFKNRTPVGIWDPSSYETKDLILSRIIRIEGLDLENANSYHRFIYIHGTNHEHRIGQPASQGCIRLGNSEMIELFNMITEGTNMKIFPATQRRGKLLFIDCDSTLSTIEGIDELARARGEDVFNKVVELTNAAMNGEVPIDEVFPRRMEMIRPDKSVCDQIAQLYIDTVVPGAAELISEMKDTGWLPVILSGGFAPLIQPLAAHLGISHVEAVPLYFHEDGSYQGYGSDYPTTRNLGKNEIIREWKKAMLPENVIMIGDGVSDLETKPDVDMFIGFGGVIARAKVERGSDHWLVDMRDLEVIRRLL